MVSFLSYFYLVVVLASFLASLLNLKQQRREDTILSSLLFLTFVSETMSIMLANVTGNNLIISHIFSPIQFFLYSLYYNNTIRSFKKNNIGGYIGVIGVLLSITNSLFLQKVSTFNNFYVLFEALTIIFMTLHYFLELIRKDYLTIMQSKGFWISLTFLFFWSITYTYWTLAKTISEKSPENFIGVFYIFGTVNIITYASLATIFILNKKNILHNDY